MSSEYKISDNKKALELHSLNIRISNVIRAIGAHYNNDLPDTAYMMSKAKNVIGFAVKGIRKR